MSNVNELRKSSAFCEDGMTTADETQVGGTHYKEMPMQPWEVMEHVLTRAEFVGFLKGNIIKYSMRAGRKEGTDDAAKAKHYADKLAEVQGATW